MSKAISELTNSLTESSIANADLFVVVDTDAGETKKITREDLKQDMLAGNADTATAADSAAAVGVAATTDASCSVALFEGVSSPQNCKTDTGLTYNATTNDLTVTGVVTAGSVVAPLAINAQTGTTYTFVIGDAGKLVTSSNGSAQTITVPPNSSVAFAIGTQILVQAIGSGTATLATAGTPTINSKGSLLAIDGQFAAVTLIKTDTDAWSLIGALA